MLTTLSLLGDGKVSPFRFTVRMSQDPTHCPNRGVVTDVRRNILADAPENNWWAQRIVSTTSTIFGLGVRNDGYCKEGDNSWLSSLKNQSIDRSNQATNAPYISSNSETTTEARPRNHNNNPTWMGEMIVMIIIAEICWERITKCLRI